MKIEPLTLREVAVVARQGLAGLAGVSDARMYKSASVDEFGSPEPLLDAPEGPVVAFLRACDAYDGAIPRETYLALGKLAAYAAHAKVTAGTVEDAAAWLLAELSPDMQVWSAQRDSHARAVGQFLEKHRRHGGVFMISQAAMSLGLWLNSAGRWDYAPAVLAILMGGEARVRDVTQKDTAA